MCSSKVKDLKITPTAYNNNNWLLHELLILKKLEQFTIRDLNIQRMDETMFNAYLTHTLQVQYTMYGRLSVDYSPC